VGGRQLPVPSQCETGVKVDPEQEAVPQATLVELSWHAPAPSQVPVLPQGGLAVQRASATPTPMLAHMPELPQAWQSGQLATPQQKPSVQLPVPHSWAAPQVAPEGFLARQLPPAPLQ
jgi:hypothetical protein